MKNKMTGILLFVLFFLAGSPVFSSISRVEQLGASLGDIRDPESDTLFINPAYGITLEKPVLSTNFFLGGPFFPCYSNKSCFNKYLFSGFLDTHYLHPLTPGFGFFLGVNPVLRHLLNEDMTQEAYLAGDVDAGAWFRVFDNFTAGISGKYFSKRLIDQPGYLKANDRNTDLYLLRGGFSVDVSDNWNIGYSLEFRRPIQESTLPFEYPDMAYNRGFAWIPSLFLHNLLVRVLLPENFSLDNHVDFSIQNRDFAIHVASTLIAKTAIGQFLGGIRTGYLNYQQTKYLNAVAFIGADIPLFSWLDFRINMDFLHYYYYSGNRFGLNPYFNGGILARLSDSLHFEINLSEINLSNYGPWNANFELTYNFK